MKTNAISTNTRHALAAVPMALAMLAGTALVMTATPAVAAGTTATKTTTKTTTAKTSVVETVVSGSVVTASETVIFDKVKTTVSSTLVPGDATNPARLLLNVAFVGAEGYGVQSKKKYASTYKQQVDVPLASVVELDLIFDFGYADKKPLVETESGLLSLSLTVDANGAITSAAGSIDTVPEPAAPAQ